MPTGPALITNAELAAALGIPEGDLNTVTADWLIVLASDLVRDELDQRIDYVEDDEVVLLGTGTAVLLLPELPVVAVASVAILAEGTSDEDELETGNDDPDYRVELGPDGRVGILRALGGCWPNRRGIRVVYSHGYQLAASGSASEIPGSIRLAVARSSARGYFTTDGIRQETIGRYSVTYAAEAGVILTDVDKRGFDRFYKGTRAGAR